MFVCCMSSSLPSDKHYHTTDCDYWQAACCYKYFSCLRSLVLLGGHFILWDVRYYTNNYLHRYTLLVALTSDWLYVSSPKFFFTFASKNKQTKKMKKIH